MSNEAKFTKGPWKVVETEFDGMRVIEFEDGAFNNRDEYLQIHVARSNSNHVDVANLIAAAPEMYEMLEMLTSMPTYDAKHFLETESSIVDLLAKARGE